MAMSMSRLIVKTTSAAATLACAVIFSTGGIAAASSGDGALQQVVSYGDLNLKTADGVAALYHRIRAASTRVCAPLESRELAKLSKWQSCMHDATARAVADINVPELTAYQNARQGKAERRLAMAD
jgi:UrcA family protein